MQHNKTNDKFVCVHLSDACGYCAYRSKICVFDEVKLNLSAQTSNENVAIYVETLLDFL